MNPAAAEIRVAADHPALPGHFPGRPVVPGALVLDAVIAALASRGIAVTALAAVKFFAPFMPDRAHQLQWQQRGTRLAFECRAQEAVVAAGSFSVKESP